MSKGYVLSLCDLTGNMVEPWLYAGYDAITIDLQDPWPPKMTPGHRIHVRRDVSGPDVYEAIFRREVLEKPIAVFAFPPCTHLAASGSRWFQDKGLGALAQGIDLVAACLRICTTLNVPWLIENPIGSLSTYWRKPDHMFDPCDLAGYAPDPSSEAYTKKTCYWIGGGLRMPRAKRVEPVPGSKMHDLGESKGRANERSVTPFGLAYGVFEANAPEKVALAEMLEPCAR